MNTLSYAYAIGFFVVFLTALVFHLFLIRKMKNEKRLQIGYTRLYRSVISSLKTGLLVLDEAKKVKFINSGCRVILQRDPDESLEGLPYTDFLYPILVPVSEKLTAAIEAKESFSREFRVFLPDGIKCFYCDLQTFVDTEFGQLYLLSFEDITEEDEIKRKLSQQLEETNRLATSKDNFFANMSHEIRTPINAILGMTYFAKTSAQEPKCIEYVQKIENASELLLGVVNDILDFSKMQEHKFTLKPSNFNLSDLKKILSDLFALKAKEKGLTLSLNFDCPGVFYINGDQFRLTQIFMNLLSNAIKFTEKGFISVFLNHEIIGNDIILRCTVRDTGNGLSEDDIFKLFTDFAQFGDVLNKSHEGTGLGLAITKRLVELMHGVIWVDSKKNKGSIFHFIVVLNKADTLEIPEMTHTLPKISRTSGHVLVVEDNEINAEIAGTLLAEFGCTIEYAVDGVEAVAICASHPPNYYDLMLMDIHMPRMNGYDAARILKEDQHVTCPILAVTATSENTELLEANADIIAGYILKPYNPGIFKTLFEG